MSLDYSLEIDSNLDISRISQLITEEFTCTIQEGHLLYDKLCITIVENEPDEVKDLSKHFGVQADLSIVFNLAFRSESDFELEFSALYEIVLFLLEKISGDAFLLYNGEIIDLQRIQGKLTFNQQQWTSLTAEIVSRLGNYCNSSDTTQEISADGEKSEQVFYNIEPIDSPFL